MPGIGDPAPDFSGSDFINGGTFTLSDHAGKVILLCFVSSGCPHCDVEIPCIRDMWNRLSGHGVQVVAVHLGYWGLTEADGQTWLTGHGVTFPAIHEASPYTIRDSYTEGYSGIPHLYVIGRDMIIRKELIGEMACDVLEGHVKDVIYMRDPVDIEMVMDVSSSMNSPSPSDPTGDSKLTMMKKAATMITDFLNDNGQVDDRMGLVWFTDDVSEYVDPGGQKLLPIQVNWAALRNQIDIHGTGICTAMGAGLQTAFDTLSPSTQKRFAILCTDGMQNIEPKVTKVGSHYEIIDSAGWLCGGHSSVPEHPGTDIVSYDTCIHTIGVGITATYASLLQEVANETSGFYKGTNDPENDLDFIYFTDLCNCLAHGSPAIFHHNAGRLNLEECESVERFYLNRSVRKITVMLNWKKAQKADLTFWLKNPEGILLNLHQEMKFFENHCLATIFLPKHQFEQELAYIGEWQMIIRGESTSSYVDYHAFVIGEDYEVKYKLDFPRRFYDVGDVLPIRVILTESKKPILKVNEILLETAYLRIPLPELLAQYKISIYELLRKEKENIQKTKKNPIIMKLEAMSSDPLFQNRLKPVRNWHSMSKGEFTCLSEDKEIIIPITLERPGLHSLKVKIHCETPDNGPIRRTDMVTVNVGPGKIDPKQTKVSVMGISREKIKGNLITVTLRNSKGQLLGPGFSQDLKIILGKEELKVEVLDLLDGTYQIEFKIPDKLKERGKVRTPPVSIFFRGKSIWSSTSL